MGLTQGQINMNIEQKVKSYKKNGYIGPDDLLEKNQTSRILEEFYNCINIYPYMGPGENKYHQNIKQYWKELGPDTHWFKSMHLLLPTVRELAKNEYLLKLIKPILGPDVMLWGSQIISTKPGQHHKWHIDVETLEWDSINIWISLKNTSIDATLKIISKSHYFNHTPQSLEEKKLLDLSDDKKVLEWAMKENLKSELIIPSPKEGQVILFHGRTWHGSFNMSNKERTSILLQYSNPRVRVKIPKTFSEPVVWHSFRPPCLMVHGKDRFNKNSFINMND